MELLVCQYPRTNETNVVVTTMAPKVVPPPAKGLVPPPVQWWLSQPSFKKELRVNQPSGGNAHTLNCSYVLTNVGATTMAPVNVVSPLALHVHAFPELRHRNLNTGVVHR